MTPRPLPTRLMVPLAALALLSACSSSGGSTAAPPATSSPPATSAPTMSSAAPSTPASEPPAAEAPAATVTIEGFEYQVPKSVPAGAEVTVVNKDSEAHTLTLGGDADVQVVVQGGKTVTVAAPSRAGSYPIGCDFHGDMTSELVVS